MAPRVFTVEEAQQTLRVILPMMTEIQNLRMRVLARGPDVWSAMERAAGNGGSADLSRIAVEFDRLDRLVHSILDTGAEIKDLSAGLVDFRTLRNGRPVYLCWKFGEEQLGFWHEIEAGFAGRQPLSEF